MKRVYFSDVLNKNFDTKDECVNAEAEYGAKIKAEEEAKELREKLKLEITSKIDKVTAELEVAQEALDEISDKQDEIIDEYTEKINLIAAEGQAKIDKIESDAKDEVDILKEKRRELISQYIKEFGSYKTKKEYSGEEAVKEFNKIKNSYFANVDKFNKDIEWFKKFFNI